MEDEEKEEIKEIINDINRDVQKTNQSDAPGFQGYTRKYQEYKEEAEKERKLGRYEKLCYKSSSILSINADESVRNDLNSPIKLLGWEITPGMVLSASLLVGVISFIAWGFVFVLNSLLGIIPQIMMLLSITLCLGAAVYTYYMPIFAAKNKVINSSGEMILSILYMVLYMRSSPNLEGAIRFAALNLDGPISKDLKKVLWDVEIGNYNRIENSLENYTKNWKDYNEDYLESLQLIKAAVNERDPNRREKLLETSIERILDGTQEKMKHYAQNLKTPVMILNAMGAMLPVLAMIILPLVSVFMGGAISALDLILTFNILLPVFLYVFMQKVLSSRPPTVSSEPTQESSLPERGRYPVELMGKTVQVPTKIIGAAIFLIVASYGILGYIAFPATFPLQEEISNPATVPGIFRNGPQGAPLPMLLRSISITFGLGLGIGVSKLLGNKKRKEAEKDLQKIEGQFPNALFELGNKISGGTPIELALDNAVESTSDLEISQLFAKSSYNIKKLGMTFEDSIFDKKNGAINEFPSKMIETVMKTIVESSQKGNRMASIAMTTISEYLQNIHETQEKLRDLLQETTTTIQLLAYMLAPVVSGVAVGMSQTIITAMFNLGQSFSNVQGDIGGESGAEGMAGAGILGNLETVISPEVLQLVVGIYLIQLLHILGTFYMKIQHGNNKSYKNMFIGKVLITGMTIFTITMILVSFIFGGLISNVSAV